MWYWNRRDKYWCINTWKNLYKQAYSRKNWRINLCKTLRTNMFQTPQIWHFPSFNHQQKIEPEQHFGRNAQKVKANRDRKPMSWMVGLLFEIKQVLSLFPCVSKVNSSQLKNKNLLSEIKRWVDKCMGCYYLKELSLWLCP